MLERADDPYCGSPPLPADLLAAWNLDPALLAVLALALAAGLRAIGRDGTDARHRRRWFLAAFLALAVAFLSPLCALSSALFSARVVHHVLLVAVAAPLAALAFPARTAIGSRALAGATLAHVVTLWIWHAPQPYAFALSSDAAYWFMELTLLLPAFAFWRGVLGRRAASPPALLAHLTVIVQMGLLGALITFAPAPLYAQHFLTTGPFGLTALEDQQLAGLVMWVPALVPYLLAALAGVVRLAGSADEREGAAA
ncbi:cytochrome c oxidase assembly protein [Aureimonas flava]|uniref:Cytochrome c oxidase assembly protein n=1 Tax=Aureimonas flava TaxID=2320271 RepID=A0A3A1WMV9_9HYPH|nr:cytochrome c oxidase assembly protein [Aureimonas flava]RIY01855.1 cytochrome c oxidase assembly protein [Aureimonas flava]